MVIAVIRNDQWQRLLDRLDRLAKLAQETLEVNKAILKALTEPNRIASIRFGGGKTNMSLTLPVGQTDKYYLTLQDAAGDYLTALDPGETVAVVSADPATILITPDATPAQDPDQGAPATVASGTISIPIPPGAPNKPITITATFTLSDGTTVDATVSDTVTASNAGGRKAGILFGTPTPLQSSSANVPPAA
jgi:hypothetical protein